MQAVFPSSNASCHPITNYQHGLPHSRQQLTERIGTFYKINPIVWDEESAMRASAVVVVKHDGCCLKHNLDTACSPLAGAVF